MVTSGGRAAAETRVGCGLRLGGSAMIFRLSQQLNAKIKAGNLETLPLHENPLADWWAALFVAGRTPYLLLSNTKSLYSTVLSGKGIANDSLFIERALRSIQELMEGEGQGAAYERFIASATATVRFAKALNRSVTGSMNDLIRHATAWLAEGDLSPPDVGVRLNDILLSALARNNSVAYGKPRDAFRELAGSIEA
jgi:uncharacterized protein DUF6933